MPNGVTYSDEKTLPKVYKALFGAGDLDFDQVQAAIDRLQSAGILFREEAESTPRGPRGPRTPAEAAAEALQSGVTDAPVQDANMPVTTPTQ